MNNIINFSKHNKLDNGICYTSRYPILFKRHHSVFTIDKTLFQAIRVFEDKVFEQNLDQIVLDFSKIPSLSNLLTRNSLLKMFKNPNEEAKTIARRILSVFSIEPTEQLLNFYSELFLLAFLEFIQNYSTLASSKALNIDIRNNLEELITNMLLVSYSNSFSDINSKIKKILKNYILAEYAPLKDIIAQEEEEKRSREAREANIINQLTLEAQRDLLIIDQVIQELKDAKTQNEETKNHLPAVLREWVDKTAQFQEEEFMRVMNLLLKKRQRILDGRNYILEAEEDNDPPNT